MNSSAKNVTNFRTLTILGLVVGALGVFILLLSGIEFPVYPPPGIIILLAGALFVWLIPKRWSPAIGVLLALFIIVGFLLSPTGLSNLAGNAGVNAAIGQGVMIIGVTIALVAGILATSANYRKKT